MPIEWPVVGAGAGWSIAVALGLYIIRQFSTGNWVTLRQHERELGAAEHNGQEWRTEGRIKDQILGEKLDRAIAIGEEIGQTQAHFLGDLRAAGGIAPKRKGGQT